MTGAKAGKFGDGMASFGKLMRFKYPRILRKWGGEFGVFL